MQKVFGIGLNKTGTTTLGACMKTLGYKHLSHSKDNARLYDGGDIATLIEIAKQYDSFEDWPWPLVYKELATAFPDAKFILTTRQSDTVWLRSLVTHAYKLLTNENYHELVYGYKYPLGHRRYHLDFYNRHNKDVVDYFRNQPGRLLAVCWEDGDGWKKLCQFLGAKVPDIPFPHSGATKDWAVPWQNILINRILAVIALGKHNKQSGKKS